MEGSLPRRSTFPDALVEWLLERLPTYSGGTAPVFHRTSPLCLAAPGRRYDCQRRPWYRVACRDVNQEPATERDQRGSITGSSTQRSRGSSRRATRSAIGSPTENSGLP